MNNENLVVTPPKLGLVTSRAKRQRFSSEPRGSLALAYAAAIENKLSEVHGIVWQHIQPSIDSEYRNDMRFGVQRAFDVIEMLIKFALKNNSTLLRIIGALASRVITANIKKQKTLFGFFLKPDIEALRAEFIRRNVMLIESLIGEQITRVRFILEDADREGDRAEDVAKKIQHEFDLSPFRAKRIAVDQILTLNAQTTRETHKRAGVEEYIWTTMGEERVRNAHHRLDGRRFSYLVGAPSYDNPPDLIHPGDEIYCRCFPYPIIKR